MRILCITDLYPVRSKPRGIFIKHSLEHLADLCEIRIIQPVRGSKNEILESKIPIYPVPYTDPFFVREFTRAWKMKSETIRVAAEVNKNFVFDIVMGIYLVPGGWLAAKIAEKYKKPLVVIGLGSDIHLFHKYLFLSSMVKNTLKAADLLIVNAENLKDKAASLGISKEKIRVLEFGYDDKIFVLKTPKELRTPPMILMVANLVEVKMPQIFIKAALHLLSAGCNFTFEIAGDGYLKPEIEKMISESQYSNLFTLHGIVSQQELAKLYRKASCTVLTSHSEGLPFCLIESLASGTPVVATELPGVKEIVKNNDTGILVPIGSAEKTAEAIRQVCAWEKTPQSIAESVKNRTWNSHAEKFMNILTLITQSDAFLVILFVFLRAV